MWTAYASALLSEGLYNSLSIVLFSFNQPSVP